MKVVFGIVVYQIAYKYIDDLIYSINQQDSNDFEVLIINDDIDEDQLQASLVNLKRNKSVLHYNERYSPIELRIKLLTEAKNRGYDLLIIGDADDCFSENRVSKVIRCSEVNPSFSFFYNNIKDFSGNQVMPDMPTLTKRIDAIGEYNYLGMTNTGIRMSDLSQDFIDSLSECNQMIFDWYLYSRILLEDRKGIYVPEAVTFYRTHDANIAGDQSSNPERVEYEISVKTKHYESLKDRAKELNNLYELYRNRKFVIKPSTNKSFWWGYTKVIY